MEAFMVYKRMPIFNLIDVMVHTNLIQLSRWLPCVDVELEYCLCEYIRFLQDETRKCMVVYENGKLAIFVDDKSAA
jgi:hypothetical protein